MYLLSGWNVSDRTCFFWKRLVYLNWISLRELPMRSNRAVMFVCFILSKLFRRCQLWTEWQMMCCGCSRSIALCDAGDARTGSSTAPHHLPPAPSSPRSEYQTCPFASSASLERGSAAGLEAAELLGVVAVPGRHLSPGRSPVERQRCRLGEWLCLASASWQGLQRAAPLESNEIKPGRRIL